jgi:hypothetical protein
VLPDPGPPHCFLERDVGDAEFVSRRGKVEDGAWLQLAIGLLGRPHEEGET